MRGNLNIGNGGHSGNHSYSTKARASRRLLRAALLYTDKFHFAVFPCRRNKSPLTKNGFKDATRDPAQIRIWWSNWPNASIGIATGESGIVVLDVDPRHYGDQALETLEDQYGKLPVTPEVLTGGGGRHLYFKFPEGPLPSSNGRVGPGLDVKASGGYVIAPPSIHDSGREYTWEHSARIDEVEVAELPAWLCKLARGSATGCENADAPKSRFEVPPKILDGERNSTLYAIGRALHARGFNFNEILATLRASNQDRCQPPLPDDEVAEIAGNAFSNADAPGFKAGDPDIIRLAELSPLDYDKCRKAEARRMGVRVDTLDDEVQKLRKRDRPEQAERPAALAPPAPPPHPEEVEPRQLLDGLAGFIKRFVILDKHSLVAVTLWIAFTYCFDIAETSPRIRIKSPDKRCGKSRLLEALALLIPHSITASNMSASAIFRTIDAEHCCLLIDEADTFARQSEELRGLLNSGHTRVSAYVIRSVPTIDNKWTPQRFSTWCPMAIAGIGALPDTVEDRSVTIVMKRKLRFERVERLTRRNHAARADASLFASKLTRFAADNLESLRNAEPPIPDALNDRAADNWEHLLAIADLAGNTWGALAREAAVELSGDRENADNDSLRTRLLADIYDIFEEEVEEQISSTDLCVALVKVETAPWPELSRGKPISPARLARMLKPFEIYPGKIDMGRTRGYKKGDFKDAFTRYLSRITSDQTVKVS